MFFWLLQMRYFRPWKWPHTHWGKNPLFIQKFPWFWYVKEMWILKMRFQKGEFCKKWDFRNVNFVKNEILEMWILQKLRFQKGEFCKKLGFSICELLDKIWIFAPVCSHLGFQKCGNYRLFEFSSKLVARFARVGFYGTFSRYVCITDSTSSENFRISSSLPSVTQIAVTNSKGISLTCESPDDRKMVSWL